MEVFAEYSRAIVSLALFALITLGLSPMAGVARNRAGVAAGALPKEDYANRDFRICRAYQNAAESLGAFAAVIAAAILAGAAPFWVNLFASLAVLSRLIMVFVHIQGYGVGKEPGPRTMLYVFGWLMMLLLALMAIGAAF
ncbi:hypothetical protein DEA8626_00851 [Defluviimonas aquaemixtae]|uniref:MAPEG family protein n=1 Tax=Albidovulum aquaemixtae TaxID=1542388 RepID=A0A2R8B4A7_9RHOB|nr:MAPEG family protein [Defluviimonas aquaemixtae]SPH17333.1 hypothetical protein DEA8626_00851 [Defluviimonas aquaemixtae]